MPLESVNGTAVFYGTQTVFLTGSTGGLGGCLLYKLALVLRTPKIYVLVRGSTEKALERWRSTMPAQVNELVRSESIVFVVGDMTKPMLGIEEGVCMEMKKNVTLVIHGAANISFKASIDRVVADNCLSSLELARMASGFEKLDTFVQVSSAYANTFLEDGQIEEKIYPLGDPEAELSQIMAKHPPPYLASFPWPYAYSKHLTERLLTSRFPSLPLLIVRPTSIGPAISQPYELYGPKGSCPISTLYSRTMYPIGGINLWHAPKGESTGRNIVDEIPVDFVANILLQHVSRGTRGVIHASSLNYISKTMDQIMAEARCWIPAEWRARTAVNVFTTDRSMEECSLARFYKVGTRNWTFDNTKSRKLALDGLVGLSISNHDVNKFTEKRVAQIFHDTKNQLEKMSSGTSNQTSVAKL